jgi:N-acyl homoserine lactone hydrolase
VVVAGDTAVFFGELDEPRTEGQRLVRTLDPEMVWLAHEHEPWRPCTSEAATPTLSESSSGMPS